MDCSLMKGIVQADVLHNTGFSATTEEAGMDIFHSQKPSFFDIIESRTFLEKSRKYMSKLKIVTDSSITIEPEVVERIRHYHCATFCYGGWSSLFRQ